MIAVLVLCCLLGLSQQACNPACNGCWVDNSISDCQGCLNNYLGIARPYTYLTAYSCYCPSGTYYAGLNYCPDCHYSCDTCFESSSNQCYTCPSGSNRYGNGSTCPCNLAYYDAGSKVCSPCHYSCRSCSGSSDT
jgi:hypothetical protein